MFGELKFNTAHWLKLKINKLYIQKQIFTDFEMALQTLLLTMETSRGNRGKNVLTKFACNEEESLTSTFYYRFKISDVGDVVRGCWSLGRYVSHNIVLWKCVRLYLIQMKNPQQTKIIHLYALFRPRTLSYKTIVTEDNISRRTLFNPTGTAVEF